MSDGHIPVDAKDDTAEYRAQVWKAVEQRIGAKLTTLPANTTLQGVWDVAFDMFGSRQPMFRYDFGEGNTVTIASLIGAAQTPQPDKYSVRRDGQLSISGETYHAATTDQGNLVLFNGDSSLVLVATKR